MGWQFFYMKARFIKGNYLKRQSLGTGKSALQSALGKNATNAFYKTKYSKTGANAQCNNSC